MKVKNIRDGAMSVSNTQTPDTLKNVSGRGQSFERHFENQGRAQYEEKLAEMAKDVNTQGELLTKRADMFELQKYREMIGEFISTVVSGAYRFNKETTFDSKGRRRVFATVDKINEKLESLAEEILRSQQSNLNILNTVDDIRGLIVDLML